MVGLVVNAVDDSLGGAAGLDVAFTQRAIKALPDVLAAASTARRAVLLLADHGHVLAERFGPPLPGENRLSGRCRELEADEPPGPGEVVLEGDAAWRKSPRRRLAALFRETDTYSGGSARGAHGGASLAEVVAPALLIASESLVHDVGVHDAELDLRQFPRPRWWDMDVAAPVAEIAAEPAVVARRVRPSPQLALPVVVPAAPATPASGVREEAAAPRMESRWAVLLRASEEYREAGKREREYWDEKLVPAVDLLAEHGGMLAAGQFASRLGELPFRVGGLVAALAEHLNLEQHPVLVHDARAGQVRLDLELLKQLFGG